MKSLRVPKSLTFSLSIPRNLTGPLNPQKIRQSRLQTPPKTSSSLWDLPALGLGRQILLWPLCPHRCLLRDIFLLLVCCC